MVREVDVCLVIMSYNKHLNILSNIIYSGDRMREEEEEREKLFEELLDALEYVKAQNYLMNEETNKVLVLVQNLGDAVQWLTYEIVDRTKAKAKATPEDIDTLSGRAYDTLNEVLHPDNLNKEKLEDILLLLEFLGSATYLLSEEAQKRFRQ